jgi:hypothetical protein
MLTNRTAVDAASTAVSSRADIEGAVRVSVQSVA